ncbi:vacuolar protein sorting-associated protein 13C-like [Ceratina calcarata]|uniref:Vacuolar protein sorting-associated protein 13C-like n=1 Tax=Ceratina calcarata TaxID=156304 RepID=A0AAJ7NDZ9_9HYME|nr:vacuolar protein sorting-associated protein 13C-like [Ceratina calcarata]
MFEGAIAAFLNRLLGNYVEDLDTEQFNVGIFSGDTCLTDLKLKPEALYQLGLPIRVEVGLIGKIVLKIPWSGLFSQPIILCIEDIYIVAVPAADGPYDAEIQKKLRRAEKRKILEDLKKDEASKIELFDNLLASVTKNFQITINNVHIRYEQKLNESLCACGVCMQSISVMTTNSKWKPGVCAGNLSTIYQLIRAESLSIYMDHDSESAFTSNRCDWDMAAFFEWKNVMHQSLQTFGMRNKEFQFLLKPFTAKIKLIIHKGNESQTSRMLVDIVLHDVAMQVSEMQYLTFCYLYDSLSLATVNKPYVKYRPDGTAKENPTGWWKYAYDSVLNYNVRPYNWPRILEHRKSYRKYKEACLQSLLRPNDTELKLDMQKYEDCLSILNIVIAREHARQELKNRTIEEKRQKNNMSKQNAVEDAGSTDDEAESNEKQETKKLMHQISNETGWKIKLEKLPQPIDYKFNFTLANCCLSLISNEREILVVTITQLLTSIEARPALSAFKASTRAESFVIEGVSNEGDLVPLLTVDNILTGNVSTNFLAIDFEKNGENADPTFDVSIKLEAVEVTYYHHAVVEIIRFFKLNDSNMQTTVLWAYRLCEYARRNLLTLMDSIVSQTLRISFKIDIKGPYIVFPEYGSVQKGGHVLVVDFGNVSLSNELQATNLQLEDATLMELEELLYDRIHIVFSGAQILFCHSGDDWRAARKRKDSEYHFLPKIHANTTVSYSIKPEYYQLPRTKVNVSISSVKFNLSENKIRLIVHFLNLLLLVYQENLNKYEDDSKVHVVQKNSNKILTSLKQLKNVQRSVCLSSVDTVQNKFTHVTKELLTNHVQKLDRSVVSSEVSEEDLELLSKTINLSGFDDNVSPCNHINILLRFAIGELSVHLGVINDGREEPYLNLRLHALYLETAIMQYGPAVQFGMGSILLVDKTNAGVTGSYLELISTEEPHEVLVVSYRKVKSNCPDFKSHFKSIERSLVINLLNINVNLHRPALIKIREYWHGLINIFEDNNLFNFVENVCRSIAQWRTKEEDPPIPPGAIKLNYSARLSALIVRFCDKDMDLMEIQIQGLENDCIYTANERMVLRGHLRHLSIEDLNEETLYSKLLVTEEDKVFDLKYVRHTPRLYTCSDIDTKLDDVMSDGTFKLSIGRINCVVVCKILYDLKYFLTPFTSTYCLRLENYVIKKLIGGIEEFKKSGTKLHIFIDIQGPVFLLPQRKDVPSLLVLNTGVLSVENFFKKVDQPVQSIKLPGNDANQMIIDNILIKLKNMTVSRAIMTLSQDLEIQEPIIEPVHVHFDIKRRTEYRSAMELETYGLFNVQGSVDFVYVNLSQRDLKSSILVWKDNVSKIIRFKEMCSAEKSAMEAELKKIDQDNAMVKKLEDFLTHNENSICEINTKLSLDGLQLNLFLDSEEVLSSPVRDLNHGLCRLTFGELINTYAFYNDRTLKMKLSLQSCVLQDTRKDSQGIKKIIQSPARQIGTEFESCVSVSMSPIVDVTYNRAPTGERCLDALVQEVRINLSVPFVTHLARYVIDSFPGDQVEEGIVNHGYENNNSATSKDIPERNKIKYAQYFKEEPDTSVSVRIQKPEILFFGDPKVTNAHVILLETEVSIESSRHSCSSSIVCTLTDVRVKSRKQGNYSAQCATPYWLLCPCDIEICRKREAPEFVDNYTVAVNKLDVHLSAEIVHTFISIADKATSFVDTVSAKPEDRFANQEYNIHTNLWTPKKISNVPYKKLNDDDSHLIYEWNDRVVTVTLKPLVLCVLLEIEYSMERLPVVKIDSVITASINDWLNDFNLESNLKLHASCYNTDYNKWEPVVDLCSDDDATYRPWELSVKMRHGEAFMVNSNWTNSYQHVKQDALKAKKKSFRSTDQDVTDMVFITPDHLTVSKANDTELYSTYEEDSDTDDEEGQKKLARTSNYLFSNTSSGDEDSDSDDSSTNEDEGLELTPECNVDSFGPLGRESIKSNDVAVYIVVVAEDKFNLVITPNLITVIDIFLNAFQRATSGIPTVPPNTKKLNLHNNIGHESRIELLVPENEINKNINRVIASQDYHDVSPPGSVCSSPEAEAHSPPTSPFNNELIDLPNPETVLQTASIEEIFEEDSPISIYKSITGEVLHIIFNGFEDVLVYCPKKQGCNLIPLRPIRHEVRYHLVIEATINNYLHRTITVRSPLQFRNETSYALGLYYKKSLLEKLGLTCVGATTNPFDDNIRMTIIEPDSTYSVPLYIAYHFPVYILPAYLENYQVSEEGVFWKELSGSLNVVKDICCKTKENGNSVFCVKVSCNEVPVTARPSCQVPNYLITIYSPMIFNNQLPFVIDVHIPIINYEVKIEPGEKINMHSLNCNNDVQFVFKIQNYLGAYWTGTAKLNTNLERKFVLMNADSESESTKTFLLCIELCKTRTWHVVIQSQYWMMNKSGLPLYIQECHSHVVNEIPEEELMVFSQKNNKKSMVRLRAHQSEWSLPFGLEGITSMSLIVCKDVERGRKYRILTEIESSRLSPNFTKIITFLPYFYINNKTKKTLRFMEENDQADLWNDLLPGQNMPFWPVTESMKMRIKWRNSQLVSQHFSVVQSGKTVLRMDNGSAITVEIKGGTNSPYCVTFQKYTAGDIPVRIDNFCDDLFLKVSQQNLGQVALVNPFQSLLYTWDDPTKSRELVWNVYNNKRSGYSARFQKDGYGQEVVPLVIVDKCNGSTSNSVKSQSSKSTWLESKSGSFSSDNNNCDEEVKSPVSKNGQTDEKTIVYWVSYMEGNQRILLFTQQETVFLKAKSIVDPEPSKREIFLSLAGIGVSVVTRSNEVSKELVYANVTDSAAHWELYFDRKWKSLSLELSVWIESKYVNCCKKAQLENFIDVDLVKMHMTKPFFGKLRRTYSPGIWLHYRQSMSLTHLQGYVHRIQLDNQIRNTTFPVILHSNLQKSMINYAGNRKLKHCIEFACLKQRKLNYDVYKGVCVIVREFDLNLQEGFLLSLIDLIPKKPETKYSIAAKLRKDVSNVHLLPSNKNNNNVRRKSVIEHMYISPILIRLILLADTERPNIYNIGDMADYKNVVRFIFEYSEKGGGSEKHADFRLPCYQKNFVTIDSDELLLDLSRSYVAQTMQQFHVLIRSTTVLGNQCGYNFKSPGDYFYESNTLILCGDEIAEKLSYEVACQLGYATLDTAQTSALNFDVEPHLVVQPKVKEPCFQNKDVPPSNLSIRTSFSTEIELETCSLVTAFVSSVHQEELKYFFKTLGKKTSIFFNTESSSSRTYSKVIPDIIKRAQEIGHKFVSRIRLPRYINPYKGVEIFCVHKSKGMHLLSMINKNPGIETDTYWAHTTLSNDGKHIALVSLQRLYFIEKGCTWGSLNVKWTLETHQLLSPPTVANNKLILHVNKNEDTSSPVVDWYLESDATDILEWLCQKINIAMILNMENSICSKQVV